MFRKVNFRLIVILILGIVLFTGDVMAGIWFKGEAVMRDKASNVEKHRFFLKWIVKARGAEDSLLVQMTVSPDSPVINKSRLGRDHHDIAPMDLLFDMCDDKGKSLGEVKFVVPSESWRWTSWTVVEYLRKWERNKSGYIGESDLGTTYKKVIMLYFHGFFTPPKECVTLFLKSVRTCGEDIYYDLGNVGPKIVSNRLKSSIDKRSIRCDVEVNAFQRDSSDSQAQEEKEQGQEGYSPRRNTEVSKNIENDMWENSRFLREQLRELKAKSSMDGMEIERLRRQSEQMKNLCNQLQEEKTALMREHDVEMRELKEKLRSQSNDSIKLENMERAYSESTERVKGLCDELDGLRQEKQALQALVASSKSRHSAYIVVIVVLVGLLVGIGLMKFVRFS